MRKSYKTLEDFSVGQRVTYMKQIPKWGDYDRFYLVAKVMGKTSKRVRIQILNEGNSGARAFTMGIPTFTTVDPNNLYPKV